MFMPCVGDNGFVFQVYLLCPVIFFNLYLHLLHLCDQTFDQLKGILNASWNLLSLLFSATLWNEPVRI